MPIAYSIDREDGCVVESWTGDVTARELSAHWRRYLADPEVLSLRRTLVDLRHCRLMFTAAELKELVARIVVPALHGSITSSRRATARTRCSALPRRRSPGCARSVRRSASRS